MKLKKTSIIALSLLMILSFAFTGCSSSDNSADSTDPSATAEDTKGNDDGAAAPGEAAGFEEFPIGDDQELGPLNVAAVYFQPVDMEPVGNSLPASEADMHIEADISALKNDLGYGVGDFVPYLTVKYEILNEAGKTVQEGTFMPMSASDGPHYGANIKLGEAGTYKVRFIIENPEAQGYLLHVDKETGVTGKYWTDPLIAEWDFDYVPRVW
ncbi:iron transporter [Clostridium aminobutyricum]|uniref:Iron transporter n=1 Tax=Clostridium aminobutyricum TaxID=33953 RepID=A0A939IJ49_CLOAM|nr:iron transporter [Clostridium aminobutyricum]MBN7773248.1 iron transporter [Clostridium aminobutyricum]